MTYALDTNTVSYWIQKNRQIAERMDKAIKQGNTIVIPSVTYYEIRRGFKHKSAPGKEYAFLLICKSFTIGEMNIAAWEEAANIYGYTRKVGNPIDDTDIFIAAFCIVNNYTLVTNNVKHFKDMDGLIYENWIE